MAKKFDEIKTESAASVLTAAAKSTGRGGRKRSTTAPEEKARREAEGRTQGCKGCKAPRINLALTSDNWEFLQRFKGIVDKTPTAFINSIIETYRTEHAGELAKAAKKYAEELEKAIQKGTGKK